MKTYTIWDSDDFYALIETDKGFNIGMFSFKEQFSDNPKPYHVYEVEIPNRESAEKVCEMLKEEYFDAFQNGQGSCY
jgi:hypothetical protein